jgi:cytochrome bd ubiquinol oxidase subunit II
MELNTIWFILVAVLFSGYFVLEGFDFGVGVLLPFIGKNDQQRRIIINTIGPHWDGNEVWIITAGGAIFAAFPNWYATLFSGFYLPLFLILLGLIFRGVSFEFRSKDDNPVWRSFWDWSSCIGSLIPALLWGVAFANFLRGVPINSDMIYTGGFWNLLNGYALLGGLVTLLAFLLQGSIYLSLKLPESMVDSVRKVGSKVWFILFLAFGLFFILTFTETDIFSQGKVGAILSGSLALASILVCGWFIRQNKNGLAFIFNSLSIVLFTATSFLGLYPRVLISSLDPQWSLTISNAASNDYTLRIMAIVALIFVPIILVYQIWVYWLFRKRAPEKKEHLEY